MTYAAGSCRCPAPQHGVVLLRAAQPFQLPSASPCGHASIYGRVRHVDISLITGKICRPLQSWGLVTSASQCVSFFRLTVAHLSADILQDVVGHLDTTDICALSCTCRLFRAVCSEAAPFLRLSLFPHQVCTLLHTLGVPFATHADIVMSNFLRKCEGQSRGQKSYARGNSKGYSGMPLHVPTEMCTSMDAGAREGGRALAQPHLEALSHRGRRSTLGMCGFRRHPNRGTARCEGPQGRLLLR